MPNLIQLGTNGPFVGSIYSVVVYTDDSDQTWIAHHTDKTRNYKTDWDAQKVAEAIEERPWRPRSKSSMSQGRRPANFMPGTSTTNSRGGSEYGKSNQTCAWTGVPWEVRVLQGAPGQRTGRT
jgi:hypothetical protein